MQASLIVITRRCCRGPGDLFLFQCQFKLIKGFGAGAKPVTPQPGQLMLELLDPVITLLDLSAKIDSFVSLRRGPPDG